MPDTAHPVPADPDTLNHLIGAERDRIASELTNRLARRLFGAGLTLQRAQQRIDDPDVRDMIAAAVTDLDHAIGDIRQIVFDTHDSGNGTASREG